MYVLSKSNLLKIKVGRHFFYAWRVDKTFGEILILNLNNLEDILQTSNDILFYPLI